eukprot:ANDGO_03074.mRNA.1 Heat shock 70 kDa protein 17
MAAAMKNQVGVHRCVFSSSVSSAAGSSGGKVLLLFVMLAVLLLSFGADPCSGAVLGIDFGSDTLKLALVQPGSPISIVENEQSKRKIPNGVSFVDGGAERFLSELAGNMAARAPQTTFLALKHLLGVDFDRAEQIVKEYALPYSIERDPERGTVLLRVSESLVFAPEQLVAMVLANAKRLAEIQATANANSPSVTNIAVRDCVVAVPFGYSEVQRRALENAAKLADLSIISFVSDHLAAAIRFGLSKLRKRDDMPADKRMIVMFVDVGASGTSAAVVEYVDEKDEKKKTRALGSIVTLGAHYAPVFGGDYIDTALTRLWAGEFDKLHAGKREVAASVMEEAKAVAKMRKEAKRVREILSANDRIPVVFEGLTGDLDYKTVLDRATLEGIAAPVADAVEAVVRAALVAANVSAAELEAIEVIGGTARMPLIRNRIRAAGQRDAASSLNSDEAVALGTANIAANAVPGMKVKTFEYQDLFYGNALTMRIVAADGADKENKDVVVFEEGMPIGKKKNVNFKTIAHDFQFTLNAIPGVMYSVKGIGKAVERIRATANETRLILSNGVPRTKLTFSLDDSSRVAVLAARAMFDVNVTVLVNRTVVVSESENRTELVEQVEKVTEEVALVVEEEFAVGKPMSTSHLASYRSALLQLDREEKKRRDRARARNDLESYVYAMKEKLGAEDSDISDDEYVAYSTPDERSELRDLLNLADEWNFDHGDAAPIDEIKEQHDKVSAIDKAVAARILQTVVLPEAFNRCLTSLDVLSENLTQKVLPEDVEKVSTDIDGVRLYVVEQQAAYQALAKSADPLVTDSDVDAKCEEVKRSAALLVRKRKDKEREERERVRREKEAKDRARREAEKEDRSEPAADAEAEGDFQSKGRKDEL